MDINLAALSVALQAGRHHHEAAGPRDRRQNRGARDRQRFDHLIGHDNTGIVSPADLRDEALAKWESGSSVGPFLGKATKPPDNWTGKEVIGNQTRHRIAGQ